MPKHRSRAPALADWQPRRGFSLRKLDSGATPFSGGDKDQDKAQVERLAAEVDALQNLFHADGRYGLLVVLQGLDTAGKDGTIRNVFGRTSPIGVHTVGWRAPSEEERRHDYLWRIHHRMPGRGEIMLFNRSHYEDVIVPVVDGTLSKAQAATRYRQINDFERMLSENGIVILKFMLHIGHDEQRERLQERVDDPAKQWKFQAGDLEVRKRWKAHMKTYEAFLAATHTDWAPWTIVPADSKTHRNLMVATLVCERLRQLKLRYPPADPAIAGLKIT
jgi:PPK2 family polyphosphate:nucleotide phosphotransferase